MEKRHREIISKNISEIQDNTDIGVLLPKLESKKIFPQILVDGYYECKLDEEKTRAVFQDIQKRGPRAFSVLLQACKETGHNKLYRLLTRNLTEYNSLTSYSDGPAYSIKQNKNKENDAKNRVAGYEPFLKPGIPTESINRNDHNEEDEIDTENRTSGIKPSYFPRLNSNLEQTLLNTSPTAMLNLNVAKKAIHVKHGTQFMDVASNRHKLSPYPMRGKLRGAILILNYTTFDDTNLHKPRNGADVDQQCLVELFKQLNFEVYSEENLSCVDLKNRLKQFSKDPILYEADSCFVVVMSHGSAGVSVESTHIVTFDGALFSASEIVEFFNNRDCPALQLKPKVFLFQTCRGSLSDKGTPLVSPKIRINIETDGGSVNKTDKEPYMSDVCICYSSYPGYESYREPDTGSWFIEQLCEVFMTHAHDTDVQEMLKVIAHEVKRLETSDGKKQTPEIVDRVFRPCYLNPGLINNNNNNNIDTSDVETS